MRAEAKYDCACEGRQQFTGLVANNIYLHHNMDVITVEPESDTKMHSLCEIKDEQAQGYPSVKGA
jgi:hypothetical protein